jgi:adenine-specific DNA-methyltransferase
VNPRTYNSTRGALGWLASRPTTAAIFAGDSFELLEGAPEASMDLIITSPPYCMGKAYETADKDVDAFVKNHEKILPLVVRSLKTGGSMCWQVGYHVYKGLCTPLDYLVLKEMERFPSMRLRNRIAWTFGHGMHATTRFSGRHETVLWFTKGDDYHFDLDAIRVAQKYPGKLAWRGPKKGQPSGNPNGKNPSDVWELPNVNANHVEKTDHPCQFPIGLAQRLIRALTVPGDLVFDPFCGVGSSGAAALIEGRAFLGAEISPEYVSLASERLRLASTGELNFRPAERAIHLPSATDKVAKAPPGFAVASGECRNSPG